MNRPTASDQTTGEGWGLSQYDFVRFTSWALKGDAGTAQNGSTPIFTLEEQLIDTRVPTQLGRAFAELGIGSIAACSALIAAADSLTEMILDRKSTRLNSSHMSESRMPSSA